MESDDDVDDHVTPLIRLLFLLFVVH